MRKQRGSRTHGYGQIGQHRHSGKQGGHGNAGLHKHKWSWLMINDPDHFRRDPFKPPSWHKVSKWANVGDLGSFAEDGKSKGGPVSIDLDAKDEEADPAPYPPALLYHLVEEEDDHARPEELEEDDHCLTALERAQGASQDVCPALHRYHDEREKLRSRPEEWPGPRSSPRSSLRMSLP